MATLLVSITTALLPIFPRFGQEDGSEAEEWRARVSPSWSVTANSEPIQFMRGLGFFASMCKNQ